MACDDRWGSYQTPCFQKVVTEGSTSLLEETTCGGVVDYFFFGADDSYSLGGGGISCKKCKHCYSNEEWGDRK